MLEQGKWSVAPVVLFKMVLIQHLYGLSSLRRTVEEVRANICCRWFLGYRLQEEPLHFPTISYNFRDRYTTVTVDWIFNWILIKMVDVGYVSTGFVFVDGRANANLEMTVKEEVTEKAKRYAKELTGRSR